MKIEQGKTYKTRDGRKAGPIKLFSPGYPYELFQGHVEDDFESVGDRVWRCDGSHEYRQYNLDLVSEWKDEKTITIDGKYAYSKDPFTKVRILCVDRNDSAYPVLSLGPSGEVEFHSPTGTAPHHPGHDLVCFEEKPPELWCILHNDGSISSFSDKLKAEKCMNYTFNQGCKLIKYIPSPDQNT